MTEKLGERALQAMKEMNTAIVEFKVPMVPKTKKGQMKILTEEQYIEVSDTKCVLFFSSHHLISSTLSFFVINLGTRQNYTKGFFPGSRETKSTKCIFGCR